MNIRLRLGPPFFSIAMVFFGVQYLRYGHYAGGLPPVQPWAPGGAVGAYIAGVILIVGGLSILLGKKPRCGATMIGIVFSVVRGHPPRATPPRHPVQWHGPYPCLRASRPQLSTIVFGIQHFMYAEFIATLVTSWIPAHLFWVHFTGVGMIVVGLAVITGILGQLAATWLGIMFLLWVLVLHAPRVAAALHNGDEWNSMVVALAFSGASFIVARTLRDNTSTA